jgi:excisionase family DNA binding protein
MPEATKKQFERLLTVDEACEFLQISEASFFRLRKRGKIKGVRVGSHLRIEPAELRAFVQRNITKRSGDT